MGGTGTMGRYLVDLLSAGENEIVVTTRNTHKANETAIQYAHGNAHDREFLKSVFDRYGTFDAIVDFMIYTPAEFLTQSGLLLQWTKQYVFLSSSRVYANSDVPLTEESPRLLDVVKDERFLNSEKYAIAKAKEEDILKESGKDNWTIIRPYITYGNIRFQLGVYEKEDWLYRVLNGRSIVFSKDLADKMTTLSFAGDVSKGIAAILGKDEAIGKVFHITSNHAVMWDSVLSIYTETLEKHGFHVNVIYAEKVSDVVNRLEQVKYDRIYNRSFDNHRIQEFVDTSDFADPNHGLPRCLDQFLANPSFKKINWITQARMDRYASEKTPLNEIGTVKEKIIYLVLRYLVDYKTIKRFVAVMKK